MQSNGVLVRDLSGYPTNRDLALVKPQGVTLAYDFERAKSINAASNYPIA
jgi:hypothetical protein